MTPRERAISNYSLKLTVSPAAMVQVDLQPMRTAGLTDCDILDVAQITAYFAYVNRIADGLGVTLEGGEEVIGW